MFHVPELYRINTGLLQSDSSAGNNGAFSIRGIMTTIKKPHWIFCIASDGLGWEHVSVSVGEPPGARCPTWDEMVLVKQTFWDPEDCVIQFHPPVSTYRNRHPYTLHLWRQTGMNPPMPDPDTVWPA